MVQLWQLILEFVGLGGLVSLVAFVPWSKMTLGGVLALAGALFPHFGKKDEHDPGKGSVSTKFVRLTVNGGPRILLVFAGLILIAGSVLDGFMHRQEDEEARIWRAAARFGGYAEPASMKRELDRTADPRVLEAYVRARIGVHAQTARSSVR